MGTPPKNATMEKKYFKMQVQLSYDGSHYKIEIPDNSPLTCEPISESLIKQNVMCCPKKGNAGYFEIAEFTPLGDDSTMSSFHAAENICATKKMSLCNMGDFVDIGTSKKMRTPWTDIKGIAHENFKFNKANAGGRDLDTSMVKVK